ncbi:extracellular solute-binding protein [Streptomyces rubrogriseus]|uniref:extracellular solute-binding protein n=1 Tax=Streptomyces rubrogriseus TaxID=194673 RepID=UPI0036FFE4C0
MKRQGAGPNNLSRSTMTMGAALLVLVSLSSCSALDHSSSAKEVTPRKPSKPMSLTVVDGAGDLDGGGRAAIDRFAEENPDLVSRVVYRTTASTGVTAEIKKEQNGPEDVDLVLGGPDVLGSARKQDLLLRQFPDQADLLPELTSLQDPPRAVFQHLSDGYGLLVNYDPTGPLLAFDPSAFDTSAVPATPEDLLAWAKENKGRFGYAQPSSSGSGRAFVQALPYMLGDSDPTDPAGGWDRTWSYLEELDTYLDGYPASSAALSEDFNDGRLDIIPTIIAHDVSNRKSRTWPANAGIATFDFQTWISDGHFAMIPKDVSAEALYVVLKLESYMVQREAQQQRLTTGVLTTANKDVTVTNSGAVVEEFVEKWGRPDFYPEALNTGSTRLPVTPDRLNVLFNMWEERFGAKVGD